jgi:hypothetical protein
LNLFLDQAILSRPSGQSIGPYRGEIHLSPGGRSKCGAAIAISLEYHSDDGSMLSSLRNSPGSYYRVISERQRLISKYYENYPLLRILASNQLLPIVPRLGIGFGIHQFSQIAPTITLYDLLTGFFNAVQRTLFQPESREKCPGERVEMGLVRIMFKQLDMLLFLEGDELHVQFQGENECL